MSKEITIPKSRRWGERKNPDSFQKSIEIGNKTRKNKVAINILVQKSSCENILSFPLDKFLGEICFNHMADIYLTF